MRLKKILLFVLLASAVCSCEADFGDIYEDAMKGKVALDNVTITQAVTWDKAFDRVETTYNIDSGTIFTLDITAEKAESDSTIDYRLTGLGAAGIWTATTTGTFQVAGMTPGETYLLELRVTSADGESELIYNFTIATETTTTKIITAFSFPSISATCTVSSNNITCTVPYTTNVTNLAPSITWQGKTISHDTGVARDFTNPVTYRVTAWDDSWVDYTVTVYKTPQPGNSGTITLSNLSYHSFTLEWTVATSNVSGLTYAVYYAYYTDEIDTPTHCELYGNLVQDHTSGLYSININSTNLPGIRGDRTYYLNIVVKDSANNKSAYTYITVTTPAAPQYTITYHDDGKTVGTAPSAVTIEESYYTSISANTGRLAKINDAGTSYKISAWNTALNGSGTTYTFGQVLSPTSNIDLYPVWTPYAIGDTGPAGGLIFYDNGSYTTVAPYWRYLEAAPAAWESTVQKEWGGYATTVGGTSVDVGTGQANTTAIIAKIGNHYSDAAGYCDQVTINGYSDWFLPSLGELRLMYTNLRQNGWGGFQTGSDVPEYWSSTEDNLYRANVKRFSDGVEWDSWGKDWTARVRSMRRF